MANEIPSEAQVLEWMTSLSNWGRWGSEDQLGCLNLITPSKRKQAAALVHDGTPVSCARPIVTEITADVTHQVQRYMVDSGEGRDTDPPRAPIGSSRGGRVYRHGFPWPDHNPHRRSLPLLLARKNVQRHPRQPSHLPGRSPKPFYRASG